MGTVGTASTTSFPHLTGSCFGQISPETLGGNPLEPCKGRNADESVEVCRTKRQVQAKELGFSKLVESWPLVRQVREGDPLGRAQAVRSERSKMLKPRIDEADHVAQSVCPYCAVGCGQFVYVKHGDVVQIEGDPASPVSRGRLCPKGAASQNYIQSPLREYKVKYRRPYGNAWEELSLDDAMDMIADRIVSTREENWQAENEQGDPVSCAGLCSARASSRRGIRVTRSSLSASGWSRRAS